MTGTKVAVIGAGTLAAVHMDAHRGWPRVDAVRVTAAGELAAGTWDLVDLCVPPTEYATWVPAMFRCACPFLVAGPPGLNAGAADMLRRAARKRRTVAAVTHTLRLTPLGARLRELAVSGVLGDLRSVELNAAGLPASLWPGHEAAAAAAYMVVDFGVWLAGLLSADVAPPLSSGRDSAGIRVTGATGTTVDCRWEEGSGEAFSWHGCMRGENGRVTFSATGRQLLDPAGRVDGSISVDVRGGRRRRLRGLAGPAPGVSELGVVHGRIRQGGPLNPLPSLAEAAAVLTMLAP